MIAHNVIITGSLNIPSYSTDPRGEIGTWAAGGSLITARTNLMGAGTQNATLAIAGNSIIGTTLTTCTEEYDGTTWATGGTLNFTRSCAAAGGTQNDAFIAGGLGSAAGRGSATNTAEEYDGTTWVIGGNLNITRMLLAGAGSSQNSGLVVGGQANSFQQGGAIFTSTCTEEYDGTTWTTGGGLNYGKYNNIAYGTQNAAMTSAARSPSSSFAFNIFTEEYNGTSWSVGNNALIARNCAAGNGTQNDAFSTGGNEAAYRFGLTNTELYNGTTWRVGANLNIGRAGMGGAGDSTNGIIMGGGNSGTDTEEYTSPSLPSTVNIPSSSLGSIWVDTVSYNLRLLNKYYAWTSGPGAFDGTTTARQRCNAGGTGTADAFLIAGGNFTSSPFPVRSFTDEYNGFSWIAGSDINTPRRSTNAIGSQNAAALIGGFSASIGYPNTEEYDGTTWSTGGSLNIVRNSGGAAGTQNAGVYAGGNDISPNSGTAEEYDGTTWSTTSNMAVTRNSTGAVGIQNDSLFFGGQPSGSAVATNTTQKYNGTTWSTYSPLLLNRRDMNGGGGTANSALVISGNTSAQTEVTDENGTWSIAWPLVFSATATYRAGGSSTTSAINVATDSPTNNTQILYESAFFNPFINSTGSI